jgi:hypothetical protein
MISRRTQRRYAIKFFQYGYVGFQGFLLVRLSGYGFIDVGLPPASPSDREIDSTVRQLSSIVVVIGLL